MFVFCITSCTAFWDTHFVEETWKMAYFRACNASENQTITESLATMINNNTAIFLPAVSMRTSHYAYKLRVFEVAIE